MEYEEVNPIRKSCTKPKEPCPLLPGTAFRIFIPAGAVINYFGLVEITSPSGICLIVRFPFLSGKCSKKYLKGLFRAVKHAGGCIEIIND